MTDHSSAWWSPDYDQMARQPERQRLARWERRLEEQDDEPPEVTDAD